MSETAQSPACNFAIEGNAELVRHLVHGCRPTQLVENCGPGFHFTQIGLQPLQQGKINAALDHSLQQLTLAINPVDLTAKIPDQTF